MVGRNAAFLLLLVAAVISGCLSSNQQENSPPSWNGNFTPRNMTDAERQQMEAAMMQACLNKADGAACEMQNPRGTMNGTCESRNGTLACGFGPRNGNWTPDGSGNWTGGPRRMRPSPT